MDGEMNESGVDGEYAMLKSLNIILAVTHSCKIWSRVSDMRRLHLKKIAWQMCGAQARTEKLWRTARVQGS
jgi:hypothetical protein